MEKASLAVADAARRGDLDSVKETFKANPAAVVSSEDDHRTPLHWGCASNQLAVAKYLIEQCSGVDVNSQDDEGWSPLHSASSANYVEVVGLLLRHDAKTDAKTSSGATPLHYAAAKGHLRVIEALLSSGADLESVDKIGHTPLCRAVSAERHSAVEALLKAGAQVAQPCEKSSGDSVLHIAVNNQDARTCRLLCVANSAVLHVKNKAGECPWDCAPRDLQKVLEEYYST